MGTYLWPEILWCIVRLHMRRDVDTNDLSYLSVVNDAEQHAEGLTSQSG